MTADGNDTPLTQRIEYSIDLAAAVCTMIASGKSLKDACNEPGMPSRPAFYKWLAAHAEVVDMYTRAREERADLMADEVLSIADAPLDVPGDEDSDDPADKSKFRKALEQRRQMIDARKWAAAKLNPKVYSDRTNVDHSGSVKMTHERAISELE